MLLCRITNVCNVIFIERNDGEAEAAMICDDFEILDECDADD